MIFTHLKVHLVVLMLVSSAGLLLSSCSQSSETGENIEKSNEAEAKKEVEMDPMKNKGIGPVKEVTLGEINNDWVAEGQKIYKEKCTACHKPTVKFIGPPQKGVLDRRTPEWVMNMILNPEVMIKEDPIAKKLLIEHNGAPMANQNLTEDQARKILEYIRTI